MIVMIPIAGPAGIDESRTAMTTTTCPARCLILLTTVRFHLKLCFIKPAPDPVRQKLAAARPKGAALPQRRKVPAKLKRGV